jgi:hypothetical protein
MYSGFMVLDLPLLMLGAGVIGTVAWSRNGNAASALGRASPVGAKLVVAAAALALWVILTATSIWLAFLYGFLACHFLLWGLGRLAAGLGLIFVGVVIVSIPFIWGWALLKTTVRH